MRSLLKFLRNAFLFVGVIVLMLLLTIAALMRPDIPLERLIPDYTDHTSRFLDIDGMQVHIRDEGEGPALLLVHGTFASLHTWDGWTQAFADSFRVVRLDLPGFGLTGPHPYNDYSTRATMYLVESIRRELGIESWSVAGNSLGGRVALDYARHFPEHTDRVILLNAAAGYVPPPASEETNDAADAADTTDHESGAENTTVASPTTGLSAPSEAGDTGIAATIGQNDTQTNIPATQGPSPGNEAAPETNSSPQSGSSSGAFERNNPDAPAASSSAEPAQRPMALRLLGNPRARNILAVATPKAVISRSLSEVYAEEERISEETVQRYYDMLRREGNRQSFLTRNEGSRRDASTLPELPEPRRLTELNLPVLIMWGEQDTWIRVSLGRRLHQAMPGSHLIVYEDAGHVPMEELPVRSAADARRFLSGAMD
jgi:pimeloyl-ACP methyl ester carboxylesterase